MLRTNQFYHRRLYSFVKHTSLSHRQFTLGNGLLHLVDINPLEMRRFVHCLADRRRGRCSGLNIERGYRDADCLTVGIGQDLFQLNYSAFGMPLYVIVLQILSTGGVANGNPRKRCVPIAGIEKHRAWPKCRAGSSSTAFTIVLRLGTVKFGDECLSPWQIEMNAGPHSEIEFADFYARRWGASSRK